jgi:hypothetical protein
MNIQLSMETNQFTAALIRTGSLGRDRKYVHACRTVSEGQDERLHQETLACAQLTVKDKSVSKTMFELPETYYPIACIELR